MNDAEIRTLERERFLFQKMHDLMVAQAWTRLQSLVLIGITIFSLVLAVGGIAQVARWFTFIQNIHLPWPASVTFPELQMVSSTLPNPVVVRALSQFPLWGFKDATVTALIVMLAILVFRLWKGVNLWKDIRRMRETMKDIDFELERLRSSADDER
jgi:hypothetical protein